jgi:hypothetical protein
VLRALRRLAATALKGGAAQAVSTVQDSVAYLEKRRAMIEYARFQAQDYPIGSGSVKSANKVGVERRLKGAGMHWARSHVNPLVALRAMACSDRWQEAWPQIAQQVRQQGWQRRIQRRGSASNPCPQPPGAPHLPACQWPCAHRHTVLPRRCRR